MFQLGHSQPGWSRPGAAKVGTTGDQGWFFSLQKLHGRPWAISGVMHDHFLDQGTGSFWMSYEFTWCHFDFVFPHLSQCIHSQDDPKQQKLEKSEPQELDWNPLKPHITDANYGSLRHMELRILHQMVSFEMSCVTFFRVPASFWESVSSTVVQDLFFSQAVRSMPGCTNSGTARRVWTSEGGRHQGFGWWFLYAYLCILVIMWAWCVMAALAESDDAMWGVMHDHFLENHCESIENRPRVLFFV